MRAPFIKTYANGIGFAATATDVSVLLFDNEQFVGSVVLAYPTAKSLVVELTDLIKNFEEKTGEKVKEIRDLAQKLQGA